MPKVIMNLAARIFFICCGIATLLIWGIWGFMYIRINTYSVQEARCQAVTNNYIPYSIRTYGLVYERYDTIICTEFRDGECDLSNFDGREITCYLYFSDSQSFWYASLDKNHVQCLNSGLCSWENLFFYIASISTAFYTLITVLVLILMSLCSRKPREIEMIVERDIL